MSSPLWNAPNQLTMLRLIFVPLVIISVVDGSYHWALALFIAAGLSDALDGTLARHLRQQTTLGEYLDPIADKLLLSSLFLVLSIMHRVPWKYTVLVFSRDLCILAISALLYVTTTLRDYRPSIFGKTNTVAQVAAVFFVLLAEVNSSEVVNWGKHLGLWLTMAFTLISGVHYIWLVGQRLRTPQARSPDASV